MHMKHRTRCSRSPEIRKRERSTCGGLNGHRGLDRRVALVVPHFKIFKLVVENRLRFALDVQRGVRVGRSAQLQLHLFMVVAVNVAVPPVQMKSPTSRSHCCATMCVSNA